MALAPCKDCSDRSIRCHSTCEKYLEFQADNNNKKRIIMESKRAHTQHVTYLKEQKIKRERSHR